MKEGKYINIDYKLQSIKQEVMIMQKNKDGYGYSYVDEESILLKVNQKMIELGLKLTPEFVPGTLHSEQVNYKDKKGNECTDILVRSEMRFVWKDIETGEKEIVPWALLGQQSDGSQALGSGLTYSNRYFLLKYFNSATSKDDPDKIRSEMKKEEERKAKLPQLTDEGRNNLKNIYHSETKRVFLTFDDGPSRTVTPVVLDTLKSENIKATFFLLGSRVELDPDLVKREYDEGHYIASHGYSHVYSQIYATPQSVLDEYNKSVTAIRNAIGEQEYNPHLFRFPGGYWGGKYAEVKKQAEQILEQNDVLHIDWNALTSDAAGAKTTEQFIAELEKTVPKHNSVVVLMHDAGNKQATANALPTIIKYFRDQGFEFENFYSIIK